MYTKSLGVALTFAVAFFSLNYMNPSSAAKPNCDVDPSHKSCNDDGGGDGGEVPRFTLVLTGDVWGDGTSMRGNTSGSGSITCCGEVASATLYVNYFYEDPDSPFVGQEGQACFGHVGGEVTVSAVNLVQDNGGGASVAIWFEGKTKDGLKTVHYRLFVEGLFDRPDDWLPSEQNFMDWWHWTLGPENRGKNKGNACEDGEGNFKDGSRPRLDIYRI